MKNESLGVFAPERLFHLKKKKLNKAFLCSQAVAPHCGSITIDVMRLYKDYTFSRFYKYSHGSECLQYL